MEYLKVNQIVDAIIDYIDEDIYPYAVLIDGEWGSGKTFLVKQEIIPRIEKHMSEKGENEEHPKRKVLYVSLYGVTSESDIQDRMFQEAIRSLGKSDVIQKIANIGSKLIAGWTEKLVTRIEISDLLKHKNSVLIFDDLERCHMEINRVLGFINHYVEHEEAKVIMIANQSEIGKANFGDNLELKYMVAANPNIFFPKKEENWIVRMNKGKGPQNPPPPDMGEIKERADRIFSEDALYKQMKEKLIGLTIYYRPDTKAVVDAIVSKCLLPKVARHVIGRKTDDVVALMEAKRHHNLRTIQSAICHFKRICNVLKHTNMKDSLFDELFIYCVFSSVRNKIGKPMHDWEGEKDYGYVPFSKKRYDDYFDGFHGMNGFKFIDELVYYSKKDDEHIKGVIEKYAAHQERAALDTNDPFNQLENWWTHTQKDITACVNAVTQKLKENNYDYILYPKILMRVSGIVRMAAFDEELLKDIISIMKDNVASATEKIELDILHGHAMDEEHADLYQKYFRQLNGFVSLSNRNLVTGGINAMFDRADWAAAFREYCDTNRGAFFSSKLFWGNIKNHKVVACIKKANASELFAFRCAFEGVYNPANVSEYLASDLQSLEEFAELLEELDTDEFDSIQKKNLEWLIKGVKKAIECLKKA